MQISLFNEHLNVATSKHQHIATSEHRNKRGYSVSISGKT